MEQKPEIPSKVRTSNKAALNSKIGVHKIKELKGKRTQNTRQRIKQIKNPTPPTHIHTPQSKKKQVYEERRFFRWRLAESHRNDCRSTLVTGRSPWAEFWCNYCQRPRHTDSTFKSSCEFLRKGNH